MEKLVPSAIVCSMNRIKIKELHTCSKGVFREIITNYGNHDGREDVDSKYRWYFSQRRLDLGGLLKTNQIKISYFLLKLILD